MPISTVHSFGSCTDTYYTQFFVSRNDIPHEFLSMHCTLLKFNILSPRTIDYTIMRQLIIILCTRQPTPLCSANTAYTLRTIIMCVYTMYTFLCVCTLQIAKFSVHTCTPIFFRAAEKFSPRTLTLPYGTKFLSRAPARYHFSVRHQNLTRTSARQYLSTQCQIFPIPSFSLRHKNFWCAQLRTFTFMRIDSS
jgi:hypothetical protein